MSVNEKEPLLLTDEKPASGLQRMASRVTIFTERWLPDAYVIALVALLIACVAAWAIGASPRAIVQSFGDGYWNLIPFTYQMAMVLIAGFALASVAPLRRGLNRLAGLPRTGPGAIVFIILIGAVTGLINWGFGMVISSFIVLALARRQDLRMDFRAAAAAALVGTSTIIMLGLSSGPALMHSTPSSTPQNILDVAGVLPFSTTIFLWQNLVVILIVTATAMVIGFVTTPRGDNVRTAQDLGIAMKAVEVDNEDNLSAADRRPGDWLANSPLLTIIIVTLSIAWLVFQSNANGFGPTISNLNNYIFVCLTVALLLHWRIRRFLKSVYEAVPAVGPTLIQFPIYAAIASVIVMAKNNEGHSVATYLGEFFIGAGQGNMLHPLVGIYSIVMGLFIPAAGAKWVLEAPYVLAAGNETGSNLGWLVSTYNGTEALANFLNPFWMLPVLGLLNLKARNVVGFTFVYFIFITPVMIAAFWLLSYTIPYVAPVMP